MKKDSVSNTIERNRTSCELDQVCVDISRDVGYIRKIIIKIPCIIEKIVRTHLEKIDIDRIKTRKKSGIG